MDFPSLNSPFISKILTFCGIITFMLALTFSVEQSRYNEQGVSTSATVSNINKRFKFNEISYQFVAQGKNITGDDRSSSGLLFPPRHQIGDSIEIEYLRDRPSTNRVKKSSNHAWLYIISLLMLFLGTRAAQS